MSFLQKQLILFKDNGSLMKEPGRKNETIKNVVFFSFFICRTLDIFSVVLTVESHRGPQASTQSNFTKLHFKKCACVSKKKWKKEKH